MNRIYQTHIHGRVVLGKEREKGQFHLHASNNIGSVAKATHIHSSYYSQEVRKFNEVQVW